MKASSRERLLLGTLIAACAAGGFGVPSSDPGYRSNQVLPERLIPATSTRRQRYRSSINSWLDRSRHKPHQGAREKARRVRNGETSSALEHATRWASWKKGRRVNVVDGIPFCTPAETQERQP